MGSGAGEAAGRALEEPEPPDGVRGVRPSLRPQRGRRGGAPPGRAGRWRRAAGCAETIAGSKSSLEAAVRIPAAALSALARRVPGEDVRTLMFTVTKASPETVPAWVSRCRVAQLVQHGVRACGGGRSLERVCFPLLGGGNRHLRGCEAVAVMVSRQSRNAGETELLCEPPFLPPKPKQNQSPLKV